MIKATKQFQFNCDYQIYVDFQNLVGRGNVTRRIKEFMETTVAMEQGDIDKIEIKIIDKKIENVTQKQQKLTIELQKLLQIKQKHSEKQQKVEENRLKTEAETIKKQKSCIECGKILEKTHKPLKFPKGLVCNSCFMAVKSDTNWE